MPGVETWVGGGVGVGPGVEAGCTGAGEGGLGWATLSGGGAAGPPAFNI